MTSREFMAPQVLVVGAGIGGLTAAAALARHFERVTLLERDELPSGPAQRAGVPQGRHVHGLLSGGLNALEHLLPGFAGELAAAGAVPIRVGLDSRLEQPGHDPFPQRDLGWQGYSMTRPLLEHVVRTQVARNDRIDIRSHCHVREIVATPDRKGASGVRVDGRGAADELLPADLVVDASGRGALTLDFLRSVGLAPPQESTVDVDIRYTCAVFELPPDNARGWKTLATRPDPTGVARRAIMFPIEGEHRWLLGLGGINGDTAPTDLPGYLDYARSLRTPTAYNAIRDAQLQGEIVRFAFPKSLRRHFERMPQFPCGLLPIADTICRINPSFGQGMSVAAREAVLLDQVLESLAGRSDPLADLATSFLSALDTVLHDPWSVAAQDYVYPHLAERRPADFAEKMKFQAALTRLAAADPAVHKLMVEVSHLLKPSSVFREGEVAERIDREMRAH